MSLALAQSDRAPRLELVVHGRPQGARRHRASRRGDHIVMHHDDNHIEAEERIRLYAAAQWAGPPLDCPVEVLIETWHAL